MKTHRTLFLVLISLTFSSYMAARENHERVTDSLRHVIRTLTGEAKLEAYKILQSICMDNLSDDISLEAYYAVSREYAKEAQAQQNVKRQGDIMVNDLIAAIRMNRFEEVDKNIPQTISFLKEHDLTDAMYISYKQQILSYCRRGLYDKALTEMQVLYEHARLQGDKESQFYMQYLMGVIYMYQNRLTEAEVHYRESIVIAEKMNRKPFGLTVAYSELCNMLQATGRIDEFFEAASCAEQYLEQLASENRNENYTTDRLNLWTLYAYAYNSMEDYDTVEYYCNRIDSLYGRDIVSLGNTTFLRAHVLESKGDYAQALEYIDQAIKIDPTYIYARYAKVRILSHMENAPLTWSEIEKTIQYVDSLRDVSYDRQLDEIRTQYEVDKHISEKEKVRSYMYSALAGCIFLIVASGIWIYYNRKIARKNKALVTRIRELLAQQRKVRVELLNKTTFEVQNADDDLCPGRDKDRLCIAICDILLKEKAYRNPALTRDAMVKRLGTNKELFIEAFHCCFGMSFPEYLAFLRMNDAITLLEKSDLSIESISEKVGFGTVRTFQRQFLSKYNMSPKDYRKAAAR